MAYSSDYSLATTTTFQNQVQMSAIKAAVAIKNEARTIHPNLDIKRQELADRVLSDESGIFAKLSFACVETGLSGSPTDAQVDTAISGVWNAVAGVTPSDLA